MWGEIDSFIKPASPAPYKLQSRTEDEDETIPKAQSLSEPTNSVTDSPTIPDESSSPLDAMISTIALSGSPVKSQQLGEPDLTVEEKKQLLMEQYNTKPIVFLERYHTHLKLEHLEAFSHVSDDCRTQFYCTEVQKQASNSANKKRVRNHRYAALRALQKEGQYFSEEQMRFREPLLYEQYIGQYLSEEEILHRSEETRQQGLPGLSDLLMDSYQEKELQKRLQEEQDRENMEDQEEDDNEEFTEIEWEPTAEEKSLLREEFVSQMHRRFLDGRDKDFNYREVDENPDYDNLDIVTCDAEEKYFDEEEAEDHEEEEEEHEMEENEEMNDILTM